MVAVELKPGAKQSELVAALEPVSDRLMKRYKAAAEALKAAKAAEDEGAAEAAREELDALVLFKGDLGAYLRLYTFLSQIFDYGNTAIEKRAIFYKRLLPLLEFGREREGIDLSKVVLTHHHLKEPRREAGACAGAGRDPEAGARSPRPGSGSVQEKQKALLRRDHRAGQRPVRGRPDRRRTSLPGNRPPLRTTTGSVVGRTRSLRSRSGSRF